MDYGLISRALQQMMIEDLITLIGADCEIRLFTGDLAPTPETAFSEYVAVEPVGTWYTKKAATPGSLFQTPEGHLAVAFACQTWNYTGVSAAETVTGYWVASKHVVVGTIPIDLVLTARRLTTPQLMQDALNQVRVDAAMKWPPILAA